MCEKAWFHDSPRNALKPAQKMGPFFAGAIMARLFFVIQVVALGPPSSLNCSIDLSIVMVALLF